MRSSHPRAWPAACAAEAAALQGAFWPMHDALFADQGRLEDPHLWARAEALGLDVARFDADRRSDAVVARVKASFRAGVRARRGRRRRPRSSTASRIRAATCSTSWLDEVSLRGSRWVTDDGMRAGIEPRSGPVRIAPRLMPTDAQLLARISSDATGEALRALYRAYAGELYGFALNALGDRGTAEEVVQEVFTRAWRHAEAYDPTRGSVRTWLYQIARHAIIDTRRRAAVRPRWLCTSRARSKTPRGSRSNARCWAGRSPARSRSSRPNTAR